MRITAATIKNYKRVREVAISPDADRTVVLIGGQNAQGKSSVLDALTAAFGGKRSQAADPVRHGATNAEIIVELDGGAFVIERVIKPGGESTLEVRHDGAAIRSPQAILDRIVGARFLDPLTFLQLDPREQRAMLLRVIDRANTLGDLEVHRQRIYDKRRDVGRDLTKAEGELARLQDQPVPPPIDVAGLAAERSALAEKQRAGDGLGMALTQAEQESKHATSSHRQAQDLVIALERELAALNNRIDAARASVEHWASEVRTLQEVEQERRDKLEAAREEWSALTPRREQIDADLARANEHNVAVSVAIESNKRRAAAADIVRKLKEQTKQQTELLEKIDGKKLAFLAAAELPVAGLGVEVDGLTLNGIPFAQASGAERMRVAIGLASAASPELDDVWIRDGALLDETSLQAVVEHAAAAGKRLWIERVGARDEGAIVIHDGVVVPDGGD